MRARPRTQHAYRPPARLPCALTRLLPVACAVHRPLQGRGYQAPCAHGRIKPQNPRATRTLCLPPRLPRAENVLIMRDVACAGYVAGMNATFFSRNQGEKTYSLETARQNIQDRLSFADDVGAKYASMLAFPATEQQLEANQGFDTVMSVTSRLLPWELTGPPRASTRPSRAARRSTRRTTRSSASRASTTARCVRARPKPTHPPVLSPVRVLLARAQDMKAAENQVGPPLPDAHPLTHTRTHARTHTRSLCAQDFISQGSTNNAICFLGPHRKYDRERCASNTAPRTAPPPPGAY